MDSVGKQCAKQEKDDGFDEVTERLHNSMFRQVQEVSHLVVKARLQAREADIRARYASEFAERAVSEAQSAHAVAVSLAKTSRVVASMALEFANISLETSGDGDFLDVSFPESNSSLPSGDSLNSTSFEVSFTSPITGTTSMRNPRRRSPKTSPVSSVPSLKHETTYPDDLSPEDSLSEMLNGSKSLPTVWEESYSNGWESTPEPWADKKITLQMLRKLHSKRENKQKPKCPRDEDDDKESDGDDNERQAENSQSAPCNDYHTAEPDIGEVELAENVKETQNGNITEENEPIKAENESDNFEAMECESDTFHGSDNMMKTETEHDGIQDENFDSASTVKLEPVSKSSSDDIYRVKGFGLDSDTGC